MVASTVIRNTKTLCGSVRVNEGTIAARFDSDSAGPTCLKTAIVFARFHVLFDERKGRAGDLEQERSGGGGRERNSSSDETRTRSRNEKAIGDGGGKLVKKSCCFRECALKAPSCPATRAKKRCCINDGASDAEGTDTALRGPGCVGFRDGASVPIMPRANLVIHVFGPARKGWCGRFSIPKESTRQAAMALKNGEHRDV